MEFRTGQFYDGNDGDPSTCGPLGRSCNAIGGRAQGFTFAGNAGLPLGPEGFLNLSLEYGSTQPTNRAVQDGGTLRVIDGGNSNVRDTSRAWGTPRVDDDLKVFANFGTGGERAEFYGHANYASKKVTGGFYFRNPNNRGNVYSVDGGETLLVGDVLMANGMGSANCPTVNIVNGTPDPAAFAAVRDDLNCFTFHESFAGAPGGFPGGFTPQFGGNLRDFSVVAGVRGSTMTGLNWDVSVNQGQNQVQTFIFDTVNASLGPDSPTRFEPNLLEQTETTLNADLSYAASDMINVAGGAEWRNEQYHLGAGDPASWAIGPYGSQGFSSASNGYNGTRPENAGIWDRANVAVYGDVDVHGVDNEWSLGAAVRIEDFYDSFGTTMNSKLSGRYAFTDAFAVRAGVSSGFRAPTPGQQNVLNVTTEFDYEIGDLINNGTIPSTSPVAALRNGAPLQPEQAINYSVGTVIDSGTFTFTADYFRINVDDRLTITRNYTLAPDEKTTLIAAGIAEAGNLAAFRFFVNDFSTRTQGIDIVSTWTPLAIGGRTTLSGVFNYTDTDVTDFSAEHFDADRVTSLTLGLPRTRWNIGVNQTEDHWTLMARLHYYGAYWDREDARSELGNAMSYLYPLYSGKPLVDLEVGFPLNDVTLSVGARTSSTPIRPRIRAPSAAWVTATASSGRSASTAATTTCASTTGGAPACSWQDARSPGRAFGFARTRRHRPEGGSGATFHGARALLFISFAALSTPPFVYGLLPVFRNVQTGLWWCAALILLLSALLLTRIRQRNDRWAWRFARFCIQIRTIRDSEGGETRISPALLPHKAGPPG